MPWRLVGRHLVFAGVWGALALVVRLGGLQWLFAWPAASSLLLACAYAGRNPGLLGKRPDGTVALPARLLLLPHSLLRLAAIELRWRIALAPWHEVTPGLFLGGRTLEAPPGIETVVDLAAELPESPRLRSARRYLSCPVLDRWVPEPERFENLLAEIERARGPVYVHCGIGRGRSAMVAAGVLLSRGLAADAADAERRLREIRPGVRLHAEQRALLVSLERGGGPPPRSRGSRAPGGDTRPRRRTPCSRGW